MQEILGTLSKETGNALVSDAYIVSFNSVSFVHLYLRKATTK